MSEAAALWEGVTGRKEDEEVKKQRKSRGRQRREVNRVLRLDELSGLGLEALSVISFRAAGAITPLLANHGARMLSTLISPSSLNRFLSIKKTLNSFLPQRSSTHIFLPSLLMITYRTELRNLG